MRIRYSKTFLKSYKKASRKIQEKMDERLTLFVKNPYHPILRLHALHGSFQGVHSINITGDYRLLFRYAEDDTLIVLLVLGTHAELY